MTIAVIIVVYKDVEALRLMLHALLNQTRLPDEIIVAEDGEYLLIKECIDSFSSSLIKHTHHEDNGWQRNRSTNNALKVAQSEYILFLDGDCVPYPDYVEAHEKLSEKKMVLCGRRSEPGVKFSTKLRRSEIQMQEFIDNYFINILKLKKDKIRHYEEGFIFNPDSLFYKLFTKKFRKNSHIVGCCWSAWKEDIFLINGFDEDFILPTTGEDTDLERRLKHFGIEMKSCRNVANVVHLYHEKVFNPEITAKTEKMMEDKADVFICKNGLKKLDS